MFKLLSSYHHGTQAFRDSFLHVLKGKDVCAYSDPAILDAALKSQAGMQDTTMCYGATALLRQKCAGNAQIFVVDCGDICGPHYKGMGIAISTDTSAMGALSIQMAYGQGKGCWPIYEALHHSNASLLTGIIHSYQIWKAQHPEKRDSQHQQAHPQKSGLDFFKLLQSAKEKLATVGGKSFNLFLGDQTRSILTRVQALFSSPSPHSEPGSGFDRFKHSYLAHVSRFHAPVKVEPEQCVLSSVSSLISKTVDTLVEQGRDHFVLPRGYYTKYIEKLKEIFPDDLDDHVSFYSNSTECAHLMGMDPGCVVLLCNPSNPPDKPDLNAEDVVILKEAVSDTHVVLMDGAYEDVRSKERVVGDYPVGLDNIACPFIRFAVPGKALGLNGLRTGIALFGEHAQGLKESIKTNLQRQELDHEQLPSSEVVYDLVGKIYEDTEVLTTYLNDYTQDILTKKETIKDALKQQGLWEQNLHLDQDTGSFYIMLNLGPVESVETRFQSLLERGIAVVPGVVYGLDDPANFMIRINLNAFDVADIPEILDRLFS